MSNCKKCFHFTKYYDETGYIITEHCQLDKPFLANKGKECPDYINKNEWWKRK